MLFKASTVEVTCILQQKLFNSSQCMLVLLVFWAKESYQILVFSSKVSNQQDVFFCWLPHHDQKKQVIFVYLAFLFVCNYFEFSIFYLNIKLYFSLVRMPEASIIVIALTKPFSAFPSVNVLCNNAAAASSFFAVFFTV